MLLYVWYLGWIRCYNFSIDTEFDVFENRVYSLCDYLCGLCARIITKMKNTEEKFNFVIARLDGNRLSCYTYGSEVFYGTLKQAEDMAYNISERTGKEYSFFKVSETPNVNG